MPVLFSFLCNLDINYAIAPNIYIYIYIRRLKNKIISLCKNSRWQKIEQKDLIQNISTRKLTKIQIEALSLKFATRINKENISDIITKNYRQND